MKRTELKNLAETEPFRPFTLETSGGKTINVLRSESIFLPEPRPDIAIVFGTDGGMFILDTEHVTALVTK